MAIHEELQAAVERRTFGTTAEIDVGGELDIASTPDFERAVEDALCAGIERVVIDLREVTFIDSSGINALLRLHGRATAQDRSGPPAPKRRGGSDLHDLRHREPVPEARVRGSSRLAAGAAGYSILMAKDHGSSVKNDKQYEGLREKGMSKQRAAAISNANAGSGNAASKKGGKKSSSGGGSSQSSKSRGSGSGGNRAQKQAAGRKGGKASAGKS